MGITPYDNHSSIGMYYHYRAFNGYNSTSTSGDLFPDGHLRNANQSNTVNHHDGSVPAYSNSDYEIYRTAELRAKYFLHQRIELNAVIPYRFNSQSMSDVVQKVSGIGDVNLFAGYHLIRKIEVDNVQQRLIIGAGIKLPSGSFNETSNDARADALIQPGTGTSDGFVYATYLLGIRKFGLSVNGTYKMNGTNSLHEHIENSTTGNASLFYKIPFLHERCFIIPKVNAYYEYSEGLFVYNEYISGSAMNVMMLGPALDLFYKNLELNLSAELPVYEKQETNAMKNSGRISLGVIYNFKQPKYLFKKSNSKN